MSTDATISLDEIVPGATVRMTVIDQVQYLSVRDVIMHLGGHSSNTANKTWERFNPEDKEELKTFCRQFRFPGPGNPSPTSVITFQGAIRLAMKLGGENAKKYRSSMVSILQRYYAGDGSLNDEITANELSDSPVARLARASMKRNRETVIFDLEIAERKQKLELEIAERRHKMELELAERRHFLELEGAERRQKLKESEERLEMSKQARLRDAVDLLSTLCDRDLDERTRLQIEDYTKNWLAASYGMPQQAQIKDSVTAAGASQTASLTISLVAGDMGRTKCTPAQLIAIGKEMAKLYRAKYNEDPPTHAQEARGGKIIRVNSYMERDRDLMEAAIRACVPLVDQ